MSSLQDETELIAGLSASCEIRRVIGVTTKAIVIYPCEAVGHAVGADAVDSDVMQAVCVAGSEQLRLRKVPQRE